MHDKYGVSCAFDPEAELNIYHRRLPHWRQESVAYFVTFRLKDSIPRDVAEAWAKETHAWRKTQRLSGTLSEEEYWQKYLEIPEAIRNQFEREQVRKYFVELDRCHGSCVLRDEGCAQIVAESLRFYDGGRLRCGDFVVMPNHVHWLLVPLEGQDLERILQSVKRWTATRINGRVGRSGSLWQKESFDHIVRDAAQLDRIRLYIEHNPRRARLKEDEYLHYEAEWVS